MPMLQMKIFKLVQGYWRQMNYSRMRMRGIPQGQKNKIVLKIFLELLQKIIFLPDPFEQFFSSEWELVLNESFFSLALKSYHLLNFFFLYPFRNYC